MSQRQKYRHPFDPFAHSKHRRDKDLVLPKGSSVGFHPIEIKPSKHHYTPVAKQKTN